VRETLHAILQKNVSHAFLFTGPKGLGKTSTARIVAKAVNCERIGDRVQGIDKKKKILNPKPSTRNPDIEPCNQCDQCVSITKGTNVDILEIDAASNRGIDEIRELKEKIRLAPVAAKRKVYIIDEVHMLTTEAFNALLKTLEEPPSHVIFILATTEFWKLPATIVSRSFHVQFEKPCNEELIRSLTRVVEGEGLKVEDGVLEKLCELADGAFRDAAKILEELSLAAAGTKITKEILEKNYKTDSIKLEVNALLTTFAQKNAKDALLVIDRLASGGCDFKVVIEKAVEELRLLLLEKSGIKLRGVDSNHLEGDRFTIIQVQHLLEYFQEAYKQLKFTVVPQLPLELIAVKFCVIDQVKIQDARVKIQEKEIPNSKIKIQNTVSSSDTSSNGAIKQFNNDNFLHQLIERVKQDNFSIAGVLRSTKMGKQTETEVELVTPFKFHGEKLKDIRVTTLLNTHATTILGKPIVVSILIEDKT